MRLVKGNHGFGIYLRVRGCLGVGSGFRVMWAIYGACGSIWFCWWMCEYVFFLFRFSGHRITMPSSLPSSRYYSTHWHASHLGYGCKNLTYLDYEHWCRVLCDAWLWSFNRCRDSETPNFTVCGAIMSVLFQIFKYIFGVNCKCILNLSLFIWKFEVLHEVCKNTVVDDWACWLVLAVDLSSGFFCFKVCIIEASIKVS